MNQPARLALLALLLAAPVFSEAPLPAPANLSFEESAPGSAPAGWEVSPSGEGTAAETLAAGCSQGDRCARLTRQDAGPGYSALLQFVRADPYRGKRVRLRGMLRGGTGTALLYLQVNRPAAQPQTVTEAAAGTAWKRYELLIDIPKDAATFQFGLVVAGAAEAWLDAVEVQVLGEAGLGNEPARTLTDRGRVNLAALARLVGLVRYFHPSDESAHLDWPAWVIEAVGPVEGARDAAELARVLSDLLKPIAPTVQVFQTGDPPPFVPPPASPESRRIAWWHYGLGTGTPRSERFFQSRRIGGFEKPATRGPAQVSDTELPDPAQPLVEDLGGGVSLRLPLALFGDPQGTLPRGSQAAAFKPKKPEGFIPSGEDRATRLADVILLWAALDHFYPYPLKDWPPSLDRALSAASTDPDSRAFLETLRRLVFDLHDNHATVSHASDPADFRLPLFWRWTDDRLVVTGVSPAIDAVRPGDVVEQIDGVPVREAIQKLSPAISAATPAYHRYRTLEILAMGSQGERRTLRLRRDKEIHTVTLEASAPAFGPDRLREPRPEKIAELRPGVFYVDLDRITDADFKAALPRLQAAKRILFDLRGYPEQISEVFLAHLIPAPVKTPGTWTAIRTRPDKPPLLDHRDWEIQPLSPRITAPVVFLADERAFSRAETYLDIVSFYGLGKIVGATTGGTNGEVDDMELPGGYHVTWTGSRVQRLNGKELQGVGIPPAVSVSVTREAVESGRDEVLERAVALNLER